MRVATIIIVDQTFLDQKHCAFMVITLFFIATQALDGIVVGFPYSHGTCTVFVYIILLLYH